MPGSENFERSSKILTAQVGLAGFWGIFIIAWNLTLRLLHLSPMRCKTGEGKDKKQLMDVLFREKYNIEKVYNAQNVSNEESQ